MRIEEDSQPVARLNAPDPAVTRDGDRVSMDGERIAEWSGPLLGLAIDLGTTTVALRLFDLESGQALARHAFENPQRFGGSDVVTGRSPRRTGRWGSAHRTFNTKACTAQGVLDISRAREAAVGVPKARRNVVSLGPENEKELSARLERTTVGTTKPIKGM